MFSNVARSHTLYVIIKPLVSLHDFFLNALHLSWVAGCQNDSLTFLLSTTRLLHRISKPMVGILCFGSVTASYKRKLLEIQKRQTCQQYIHTNNSTLPENASPICINFLNCTVTGVS